MPAWRSRAIISAKLISSNIIASFWRQIHERWRKKRLERGNGNIRNTMSEKFHETKLPSAMTVRAAFQENMNQASNTNKTVIQRGTKRKRKNNKEKGQSGSKQFLLFVQHVRTQKQKHVRAKSSLQKWTSAQLCKKEQQGQLTDLRVLTFYCLPLRNSFH